MTDIGWISMRRVLACALLLLSLPMLLAAAAKLYLKDGTYQMVREYKVDGDRVRFYSVERSQWEEIPLELVDLKKTENEIQSRAEEEKQSAKALAEENKAEQEQQREAARVPQEPGAYYVDGANIVTLKVGESQYVNSKKRTALRVATGMQALPKKGWIEMKGEHSPNVVKSATPEFYFRPSQEERFGMIKMGSGKGVRIVEKVSTMQGVDIASEEPTLLDVFRLQVDDGLYKVWPMKPLEPGEYAVVEYTDGTMNMQIWDFSWPGAGKGA
jgi:hypothetical protein